MNDFNNNQTQLVRGKVLIYRLFDVAEEIDLVVAERILDKESSRRRLRLDRGPRQALIIRNAPVRVHLGELEIKNSPILKQCLASNKVGVTATFWDYGVVSILFEAQVLEGSSWKDLIDFSAELGSLDRTKEIDDLAQQKTSDLKQLIFGALKKPAEHELFEDYVIYHLEEVSGISKGTELSKKVDLVALIFGEAQDILAHKSREEVLDQALQYSEKDITVIDWNSAVVLDPSGSRDIPDILEFALTQLLELRYFDDVLDRLLVELYDAIETQKLYKGLRLGLGGQFAGIARDANSRYIEFSEFVERVDNSLKVVGDFYLAVIFRAAVRRFRISDWHQSVLRKVNILAKVSELLQGEINVHRGLVLEMIIITLILFEVVSALLKN